MKVVRALSAKPPAGPWAVRWFQRIAPMPDSRYAYDHDQSHRAHFETTIGNSAHIAITKHRLVITLGERARRRRVAMWECKYRRKARIYVLTAVPLHSHVLRGSVAACAAAF